MTMKLVEIYCKNTRKTSKKVFFLFHLPHKDLVSDRLLSFLNFFNLSNGILWYNVQGYVLYILISKHSLFLKLKPSLGLKWDLNIYFYKNLNHRNLFAICICYLNNCMNTFKIKEVTALSKRSNIRLVKNTIFDFACVHWNPLVDT